MPYEVNGLEVKNDGDWMQCTECDTVDFPLLHWMAYCPCCSAKIKSAGYVHKESKK